MKIIESTERGFFIIVAKLTIGKIYVIISLEKSKIEE